MVRPGSLGCLPGYRGVCGGAQAGLVCCGVWAIKELTRRNLLQGVRQHKRCLDCLGAMAAPD